MNKKFLSAILFGALMVTSTGTFVSCKDYDDDIDSLNEKVDKLTKDLSELQAAAGKYVTAVKYDAATGKLTVTGGNGETFQLPMPAELPTYSLKVVDGKIQLLDGDKVVSEAPLPTTDAKKNINSGPAEMGKEKNPGRGKNRIEFKKGTINIMKKLEEYVISIPDFPEPGIIFRDITSILQDPDGLKLAIDSLLAMVKDVDFDVVVGAESRGFIFGTPVAYALGKSFVPARKPGKLPRETVSMEYALEYGTGTIELHKDSIRPGQKVVIIDDLIATGGTVEAIAKLVEELGGEVVKICFVMELAGLKGRDKLQKYDVDSAIIYEGK